MTDHPSPLALDRLALGGGTPDTAAHVERCGPCRAYVAEIRGDPGPMPANLRRRGARSRVWLAPVALAAAVLLAVLVPREPYVGTKGRVPQVEVWTRRGERVDRWDGAPLHPGDALRLRVDPGGYRFVTVRSGDALLYEGPVDGRTALPASWRLDAAPGPERLQIELSDGEPLPDWTATLVLPKEIP